MMKPIVILCDSDEYEKLEKAFKVCGIDTVRGERKGTDRGMSRSESVLKINHDLPRDIVACAQEYAEKNDKVLMARRDDSEGRANPIDVTQEKLYDILAADMGDPHVFLFRDKEMQDENSHADGG